MMHTYLASSQSCITCTFQQSRVKVRVALLILMFITIDASERHPKVCTCSSFPRSSKSIVFISNSAENTCCIESLSSFRIEQTGKDTCASTLLCLNNCLGEGILLPVADLSFIDHTFHNT